MVFALGFLSHAKKGELPTARFLIGTGGIFTIVSVFADLGLAIGAGMSLVILLTAILTEGGPVIQLLSERGGLEAAAKAKRSQAQEIAPGVRQTIKTNGGFPGSSNPAFNPGIAGPPSPSNQFQVPSLQDLVPKRR